MSEHEPTINCVTVGGRIKVSFETLIAGGALSEDEAREMGWTPPERVPVPWLRRKRWALSYWWSEHKPHVHLGPCDHGDCI